MSLELMSPAGSFDGVVAAVSAGADSIYFGGGSYNARRNAANLTKDEMLEAFKYCRLRGVKTHVTLNTILTDRELLEVRDFIDLLNTNGADAVIVQDLGVAKILRILAPDLPMHASTQMSVHNLAGVLAAKRMGFSRVVLARELTLEQITFIAQRAKGIELEVFVHGALCMSYSGQCYMSAAIGGRSGNRGLCAQPCRMNYSYFGGGQEAHLSLKDLSLAKHLTALEQAGVSALKIEGRMKRPEYTALVTSIYKKAMTQNTAPTRQELENLESVFSRSGFTDGYFVNKKGDAMFGVRSESDKRQSRQIYKDAQKIYHGGDDLPCVKVDFEFFAQNGDKMRLRAIDESGNEYETTALPAEQAVSRPSTTEEVRNGIRKTGGTIFYAGEVSVYMDNNIRIPASAINAMRRSCLEGLIAVRKQHPKRRTGQWAPGAKRISYQGKPSFIFSFQKLEQLTPAMLGHKPDFIYLPLNEIVRHTDIVADIIKRNQKVAAVLDRIIWDNRWSDVLVDLKKVQDIGIKDVVCGNIGHFELLKNLGFSLRGDYGLNIINSQAISEIRNQGAASCTISFEASLAAIKGMSISLDSELIVYGRLPLMITENSVLKKRGFSGTSLIDKTGRSFPMLEDTAGRSVIFNADKLYLADKLQNFRQIGMRWLRLFFTTENPKECEGIVRAYLEDVPAVPERMTRGLYYRGVQ